jgi:hypothetical protein
VFKPPPVVTERPVTRVARLLALAHHVERLVEAGEVETYTSVAAALGLTRTRLTQVLALTGLRPAVQEQILLGDLDLTDHALRPIVAEVEWGEQVRIEEGGA